jgi:hypothetical protein
MSSWLLLDGSGGYVNLRHVISIYPVNSSGVYHLYANVNGTGNKLPGSWASQADALEAARQFTHGIDLQDFTS